MVKKRGKVSWVGVGMALLEPGSWLEGELDGEDGDMEVVVGDGGEWVGIGVSGAAVGASDVNEG